MGCVWEFPLNTFIYKQLGWYTVYETHNPTHRDRSHAHICTLIPSLYHHGIAEQFCKRSHILMHNCAPFTCDNESKLLFISYWQPVIKQRQNPVLLSDSVFSTKRIRKLWADPRTTDVVSDYWLPVEKKHLGLYKLFANSFIRLFSQLLFHVAMKRFVVFRPARVNILPLWRLLIFSPKTKKGHFSSGKCKLDSACKANGASCYTVIYFSSCKVLSQKFKYSNMHFCQFHPPNQLQTYNKHNKTTLHTCHVTIFT